MKREKSVLTTKYLIKNIEQPVEIFIDPWGVPHIYAQSFYDVFFAQGFNAACDRLWQIDLWRRRGLGKLSEVLGANYVEQDKSCRLFLYRGDMISEWLSYESKAKAIATAFVNGVNEYIQMTLNNRSLLPFEFKVLNYEPDFWRPEDVVLIRSHGLGGNLESEVKRAQVACKFGLEIDELRQQLSHNWKIRVPDGLNYCCISNDVLRLYLLAKRSVTFIQNEAKSGLENLHENLFNYNDLFSKNSPDTLEGSNNWAISPNLTATGRPILANDPHRIHSNPSLRYIAHLIAPGLNVIGAGEPNQPGIHIGHNEHIAFGLTIFPLDQEDLYVYKTNADNPDQYEYDGQWQFMKVIKEEILVRNASPVTVELKYTCHGPVIYEDVNNHLAFVVRAAWLEPGMAPYFNSMRYIQSKSWKEFLNALEHWGFPSVNQVYADINGNIGCKIVGKAPVRPNWDGLFPVPGNGKYEWLGFHKVKNLPSEFNPKRGWIATANQMNLPQNFPYHEYKLCFEWPAPFRYERIAEFLSQNSNFTLMESLRLQTDFLSIPARKIISLTKKIKSKNLKITLALDLLRDWDCILDPHSTSATFFEVWMTKYLRPAIINYLAPASSINFIGLGDVNLVLDILDKIANNQFKKEQELEWTAIILESLEQAVRYLEEIFGPNIQDWQWGKLHQVTFKHPLSNLVDDCTRSRIDVGPAPQGGGEYTVNLTAYKSSSFDVFAGASFRMIIDVGNWDNSLAMNSPGQSGNPESLHYKDLFPRWIANQAFPLLYSRGMIELVSEKKIQLIPHN
ncbi:penicillin acylase family protein [Nostoc linckia]|nr:penicillin acylase family protein [Nostoc linckia]